MYSEIILKDCSEILLDKIFIETDFLKNIRKSSRSQICLAMWGLFGDDIHSRNGMSSDLSWKSLLIIEIN
jgi:hypothetical protein